MTVAPDEDPRRTTEATSGVGYDRADYDQADYDQGGRSLLIGDAGDLGTSWDDVQSRFVDDPRQAVSEARDLVEEVLGRLTRAFDEERRRLEAAWEAGDEPSTEELRQAMRRYREFFDRLLTA